MKILDETLKYFANQMTDDFKKSDIYKNFYLEATNLNCKIKVDWGKSDNLKDSNIYLGIIFCDEYDKTLEIYDEGEMSASTSIIEVDKKNRYYFSHWHKDDFVKDIIELINTIKKLKK
ncbi:MAG: hypothetical protein IJP63_05045 [Acholeplasmatales bacterium]|nr:hypothetical protein [Acholeplasmatales bacterium]